MKTKTFLQVFQIENQIHKIFKCTQKREIYVVQCTSLYKVLHIIMKLAKHNQNMLIVQVQVLEHEMLVH